MAAASGIWNQNMQGARSPAAESAAPKAGAAASSGNASDSSAAISANDFLTLLVTEMQNQDPTANTDPNEYINQLVNVNSLEQLISINQNLTTALGAKAAGAKGAAIEGANDGPAAQAQASPAPPAIGGPAVAASNHVFGNLTAPGANAAAQRVASALSGQAPAK